jgi:hypothetical protein
MHATKVPPILAGADHAAMAPDGVAPEGVV